MIRIKVEIINIPVILISAIWKIKLYEGSNQENSEFYRLNIWISKFAYEILMVSIYM